MAEISQDQAEALVSLFGARVQAYGAQALERALQALLEAEHARRGHPDPVSGAHHQLALTQGSLLRREYDLSTHGHWEGWDVGAVVVDIRELIRVNMEHGFAAGDAVLAAVTGALKGRFPTGKVVRVHPDAFAVLLPPSSEVPMEPGLGDAARQALAQQVPVLLAQAGQPSPALEYTIALVQLTVVKPSHWQVLGPLVWAECDRALTLARRGTATGLQRRRVDLDAAV